MGSCHVISSRGHCQCARALTCALDEPRRMSRTRTLRQIIDTANVQCSHLCTGRAPQDVQDVALRVLLPHIPYHPHLRTRTHPQPTRNSGGVDTYRSTERARQGVPSGHSPASDSPPHPSPPPPAHKDPTAANEQLKRGEHVQRSTERALQDTPSGHSSSISGGKQPPHVPHHPNLLTRTSMQPWHAAGENTQRTEDG